MGMNLKPLKTGEEVVKFMLNLREQRRILMKI